MLKLVVRFIGWVVMAWIIIGCGTVYTSADNNYQPLTPSSASPNGCAQRLIKANQGLAAFENENHSGVIDINAMRKLLDSAKSAQENQDYANCEVKAQQVLSYIQRDRNYEAWDRSLRP